MDAEAMEPFDRCLRLDVEELPGRIHVIVIRWR